MQVSAYSNILCTLVTSCIAIIRGKQRHLFLSGQTLSLPIFKQGLIFLRIKKQMFLFPAFIPIKTQYMTYQWKEMNHAVFNMFLFQAYTSWQLSFKWKLCKFVDHYAAFFYGSLCIFFYTVIRRTMPNSFDCL